MSQPNFHRHSRSNLDQVDNQLDDQTHGSLAHSDLDQELAIAAIADEFSQRINRGECLDIELYTQRLPGAESVIRDVLKSIELMQQWHRQPENSATSDSVHAVPPSLGEYEVLEEVGRGGMGVIYRARQTPGGRIVALKVLPLVSSLDPIRLKRFQIETQSASMLSHEHIVAAYGTGCDQGLHYYAMQFIDGHSLESYLEAAIRSKQPVESSSGLQPLTLNAVLVAIRDVARALQHAHEFGIIHRDIKPSNLMIDRNGKVWVTDFGLAHIENQATLTATGDLVGTLRYMSPEQAIGGQVPLDHRCDVYALGVTLYELLTLQPMIEGEDRAELLRKLTLTDPVPPRRVNPLIPRDLETIVLKATARQRESRYASAAAFAEDLQRFLQNRSILARRPGPLQLVTRFVSRHRAAAVAMAIVPLLVVCGLIVNNILVARQKLRADQALVIAQANELTAQREARKARAISDVLLQMVATANPDQTKGNEYTVRQLIDDVSSHLFEQLNDQPDVQADLHSTIGNAYRRLGAADRALPHLEAALKFNRTQFEADQLVHEPGTDANAHDNKWLIVAASLTDLAWNYAAMNRNGDGERLAREATDTYDAFKAPSRQAIQAWWCLQHCLIYQDKLAEADKIAEHALVLARQIQPTPPEMANIMHDWAHSKNKQGHFDDSERLAQQAIELHMQLHGENHPETAWGLDALARAYQSQKKFTEAATTFRRALTIFEKNYSWRHKSIQMTLQLLEDVLQRAGQANEAKLVHERRYHEKFRNLLAVTDNAEPSVLEYLVEMKQSRTAVDLILLTPEHFETTPQCLYAFELMEKDHPAPQETAIDTKWVQVARQLLTRAVANQNNAQQLNTIAWKLVATPDERLHQPELAVQLAEQAVKLEPDSGACWNTLGLACLRQQDYGRATEALQRSRSLPNSDEYDLLFLSIVSSRQGDSIAARDYLDQANQLYRLRPKPDDELTRFMAEATKACEK